MNTILRTAVILAFGVLLFGCETSPKPKPIANLTRDSKGRYEIQIDASYRTCSRGPCRFPSLIPRTVDTTDWIYTTVIEGEVPAAQIILAYKRGETEHPGQPGPQTDLRGSVTFSPGHMHVALQCPNYKQDSTIYRYVQFDLNGDYQLETR